MLPSRKTLICIVGPTAVGKTSLSIRLAEELQTEIISCDSRQFYKELEIGTAKPSKEELDFVNHHLINNLSIDDEYNVMTFEKEALSIIEKIHQNSDYAVMVGGSGLFVKAVCEGFDDIPKIDPQIREILNKELTEFGIEKLQQELKESDLVHFNEMDIHNSQRLIRALEICRGTGEPYSSFRLGEKKERDFNVLLVGLEMEREKLYSRIDQRMDLMLDSGLLEEVESLKEYRSHNALQTVGYKEIFQYFDNQYDWGECVRLLKRNSRRYAKRQMTWFKKTENVNWLDVSNQSIEQLTKQIVKLIN